MTKVQQHLTLLENKIENLDFIFLNKIQAKLSYRNPYFLVCLAEIIHEASNNGSAVIKNLSMNDLLSYLNKKAKRLYLNSNISEQMRTATQAKNGKERSRRRVAIGEPIRQFWKNGTNGG